MTTRDFRLGYKRGVRAALREARKNEAAMRALVGKLHEEFRAREMAQATLKWLTKTVDGIEALLKRRPK